MFDSGQQFRLESVLFVFVLMFGPWPLIDRSAAREMSQPLCGSADWPFCISLINLVILPFCCQSDTRRGNSNETNIQEAETYFFLFLFKRSSTVDSLEHKCCTGEELGEELKVPKKYTQILLKYVQKCLTKNVFDKSKKSVS